MKIRRPWKSFVHQCFFNPLGFLHHLSNSYTKKTTKKYNLSPPPIHCHNNDLVSNGEIHPIWNQFRIANELRVCKLCQCKVTNKEVKKHVNLHIPLKTYGCSKCSFQTTKIVQARAHLWKHKLSAKKAKILPNNVCGKKCYFMCFD